MPGLRRVRVTEILLGRRVLFYYTVTNSYALHANFTLGGRTYTFSLSRWSGRGLSKFLPLFFEYKDRDNDKYGVVDVSDDGCEFRINTCQKLQVILQAARDVVKTIDMIFDVHGRGIVDYCIWYRETRAANITDVGVLALAEALMKSTQTCLEALVLPYVGMGDEGIAALASVVNQGRMEQLIELDISQNTALTQQGSITLARAIDARGLPMLESFNMELVEQMTAVVISAIAHALIKGCPKLKEIHLKGSGPENSDEGDVGGGRKGRESQAALVRTQSKGIIRE